MLNRILLAAFEGRVFASFINPFTAREIDDAKQRLLELHEAAGKLSAIATRTPEQDAELQRLNGEFEMTDAEIKRLEAMARPMPRQVPPSDVPIDRARITGGYQVGASRESGGFVSLGDFGRAVVAAERGRPDGRLLAAATTYGSESTLADGGFALPPSFREAIMQKVMGEDQLLPLTDMQVTQGDRLVIPQDTTTPWQTSGGVQTSWVGEGGEITPSKPQLAQLECKLNKLAALVPVSDELLEDAPAMSRYLTTRLPEKITSEVNRAIIAGDGVAKPQGLLNSGSKIEQAIETAQDLDSALVFANLSKMWARLYAPLRKDAVWLVNQDLEPFLSALVLPASVEGGGGVRAVSFAGEQGSGRLFGRPIIASEHCAPLGTPGDVVLWSPKSYLTVMKAQGVKLDLSIHLFFSSAQTTFRALFRIGGQSHWSAPATRSQGQTTSLSNVIVLGTRS